MLQNPHGVPVDLPRPVALFRSRAHPCSYLADRSARDEFVIDPTVDSVRYEALMHRGFRRSGRVFYRPSCEGCRECVPLRIPVDRFAPSRSQRRVMRRNRDVVVDVGPPCSSDEKHRLFVAYLNAVHSGGMSRDRDDFEELLYSSSIQTMEMVYRLGRRMIGVGIVDVCPTGLSSVYFFYDPLFAARSPGVFSALCEFEECRRRGLPYWYIGFYVRESSVMSYKAQYRPSEALVADGVWKPLCDAAEGRPEPSGPPRCPAGAVTVKGRASVGT